MVYGVRIGADLLLYGLWSMVYGLWSMVYGLWYENMSGSARLTQMIVEEHSEAVKIAWRQTPSTQWNDIRLSRYDCSSAQQRVP
eukprot:1446111-Pyramimonas_sp.AAC.3